jgi:hypothetical protein
MKNLSEMSHEELLALTDDECERWIQLQMAEQGIPILQEPIKPKYPDVPEEDMTLFTAECLGEMAFKNRDELLQIVDLLRVANSMYRVSHNYSSGFTQAYPGYRSQYSREEDAFDIKLVKSRSLDQAAAVADLVKDKKVLEEKYNKEKKEYEKMVKDTESIREEIFGAIREARSENYRKDSLFVKFLQYLKLSDGNAEIALRFLGKVETLSTEDIAMLKALSAEPKVTD